MSMEWFTSQREKNAECRKLHNLMYLPAIQQQMEEHTSEFQMY